MTSQEEFLKGGGFTIEQPSAAPASARRVTAEEFISAPFDPSGSGFDMNRARAAGMQPAGPEAGENEGHFGSVAPVTGDEQQRFGVPAGSFIILKGENHPTFDKAVEAERNRGFEVVKRGNRFFSVPSGNATESMPPPQTTQEMFNLDPTIDRRGFFTDRILFPFGRTQEGELVLTPSDMMMEGLDAISAFARAMRGQQPTPEEALMIAGLITPGVATGNRLVRTGARAIPREAAERVSRETAQAASEAAAEDAAAGILSRRLRSTAVRSEALEEAADTAQAQARRARFEDLNIPATRGDITQDFAQQADEARLLAITSDEAAEPLRQFRLNQSEIFQQRANELVDSLGVPDETGARVQAALTGRQKLLRDQKNALYREVAETSPEIVNTPLFTDDILDALPDAEQLELTQILVPEQMKKLDNLLIKFGIDKEPAAVEAFEKGGGIVRPLTLRNFENFRVALGQLDKSDDTNAIKVITGPIRRVLDEEAGFIDTALRESGVTDESVTATLREARNRVRQLKTEFSPQSITGRLIDTKRDGVTPVIEASQVANQLLRPGAPIENLQRTLTSLRESGRQGTQAIGDLQASVVADALDAALRAPSRKTSGIETIGGNQFAKALDKFGDDKLDLLFANNREALNRLRDLRQTALDITPTAGAVPKGSAPVLLDRINTLMSFQGGAAIRDIFKFAANAGATERGVRQALESQPMTFRRSVANFTRQYPGIAARLGLTGAATQMEEAPEPTLNLEDLADTA